ncbi:serine hydrolase domain-containing protein [Flagellimonas sp.]|uniref:serine hydrolase domain-containing protein n=1 Tax=Flagellimonas sp. TaxID=2058762 RepID=UPI003B5014B8
MTEKIFVTLTIISSILANNPTNAQSLDIKTTKKLDNYFQKHIETESNQPVANILVEILDGKNEKKYQKAFGYKTTNGKIRATKDLTFKIASITKMFTATIILQLMEEGKLSLDDELAKFLPENDFVKLDSLHLHDLKSSGRHITVAQLLGHRSGLADIFIDTEDKFRDYVLSDKNRVWKPKDLFEFYYRFGLNHMAHFPPGEGFYYSDTNYFLLGLLIEKITDSTLAEQFRSRVFAPAKMNQTYFEYYEDPMVKHNMAHAYLGDIDITTEINTSYDWAGGGIVSTTNDLTLFLHHLFQNRFFKDKETLGLMIPKDDYGFGMHKFVIKKRTFYGHLGYWGSGVFYDIERQKSIAISVNQVHTTFDKGKFIQKVASLLE